MKVEIMMPSSSPFGWIKKILVIGIATMLLVMWFKDLLFKVFTFFAVLFILYLAYKAVRWARR